MNTLHAFASAMVCFSTGASANISAEPGPVWHDTPSPYRMQIKLPHEMSGRLLIDIDDQELVRRLAESSVDVMNAETFAYDRAFAVDPRTGKRVGRFYLEPVGEPYSVDGRFEGLRKGESPWESFMPERMRLIDIELGGQSQTALEVNAESFINAALRQKVALEPGALYLLEYWLMMDSDNNEMGVMLNDPELRLFAQLPHSYYNKMPIAGEWDRYQVLFQPQASDTRLEVRPMPTDASLEVHHSFEGRGGVADIGLRKVRWRLSVELDEPTDELLLYGMATAGHRLVSPEPSMILPEAPRERINADIVSVQRQTLNPDGVLVTNGDVSGWTIDPILPLKQGVVESYKPTASAKAESKAVTLFHGGAASIVIAVDANKPTLHELIATHDLPADVEFHRLATIPVYDGPTVDGQVKGSDLGTRYEAMVPLDYALDPPSQDGIHLVLVTIRPDARTPVGIDRGEIRLDFEGGELTLPIVLQMSDVTLKPMKHFGTIFGGMHFLMAYPKGVAGMVEDCVSVATFHGYRDADITPRTMMSLSIPDTPDPRTDQIRPLAKKYFHELLDNHLMPQSPALYAYFTYNVKEQVDSPIPTLEDWDFSLGFDEAIREFVIDREMPIFTVGRTNGHLIDRITLNNGKTYSINANPDDPDWVQITEKQYVELVGQFWEELAKHLDELGVLDRALFIVDESPPTTYDIIHTFAKALDAQPHARRIKISHTTYNTSAYLTKNTDGGLLMDDVLDITMPLNDEHFNFFEPEWFDRYQKPKQSWVYNVETDHMSLQNAGFSTAVMPLRLNHFGVKGWYCWESFLWSLRYGYNAGEMGGFEYVLGPVGNPWENPFYHHGPGVLSFFYPPDPRGPASERTDLIIPSFRLTLMRDGIQHLAMLEALRAGRDDLGRELRVEPDAMAELERDLASLWPANPTQWYLSYEPYRAVRESLNQQISNAVDITDSGGSIEP